MITFSPIGVLSVQIKSLYKKSLFLSLVLLLLSGVVSSARASTIVVPAGGDFQAAINASQCGDTIALQAGATWEGSFQFPNKGACTQYITITTSNPAGIPAALSNYPNSNRRITTAMAANMPKLVSSDSLGLSVIEFAIASHHWKFVGIEMTNRPVGVTVTTLVHNADAPTIDTLAHHIIFDQCFVHPYEETGDPDVNYQYRTVESGFIMNGNDFTWTHNAIQGFTGRFAYPTPLPTNQRMDSKSILIGTGLGNILIQNNLLEGMGNNIFVGGSGGYTNPAHVGTMSNVTLTSGTLSSSTNLNVGDLFSVDDRRYGLRGQGNWVTGRVLTKAGNNITFTNLTGAFNYHEVHIAVVATGGAYTLTFNGQTTAPIAYNADAATIQAALEALSNIAPGDISVFLDSNYGMLLRGLSTGAWASAHLTDIMSANGASLTGPSASAAIQGRFQESYTNVEAPDIPDGGAAVQWKGFTLDNVVIRRNIIQKQHSWFAWQGYQKGFMEFKFLTHLTIDGNLFTNEGTGVILETKNQSGSTPWAEVSYVTLTNNIFYETGGSQVAMNFTDPARQTIESHDYLISNNLFLWPGGVNNQLGGDWSGASIGYGSNLTITHNTIFLPVNEHFLFWINPTSNFTMKDNIIGVGGSLTPCFATPTHNPPYSNVLDCFGSDSVNTVHHNLLLNNWGIPHANINNAFLTWWPNNSLVDSVAAVGFTNPSPLLDITGNYRLSPSSPYHNAASDGKDIGVDFDQLYYAVYGIGNPPPPTPTPTPTPSPTATPTPSPTPTPTPGQYTISASPTSVSSGATIAVSWAAPAGHNSQDWIGLYRTGSASNNYVSWQYMGAATSGNMSFIAPGSNGQYEFRCYQNNAFTLGGTSNLVTVAAATLTPSIQLSNATYSVGEGDSFATITVLRSGDTSGSSNVNYATSDTAGLQSCSVINGRASERCDYATTAGTLRFAAGETSKSFTIPIIDDAFVEGNETFTVTLSGPTGATLGSPATATVTINDNDTVPASQNPIDAVQPFVTQQYIGFLGRLPDPTGLANWMATLNGCPGGGFGENDHPECDRVHVSAGFFLSPEFQGRGYWAYKFYEVGFDRRPTYAEFVPDMALIGGPQSPESEALTKATYTDDFVQRSEFTNRYNGLSDSAYLSALEQNAEVAISNKAALLAALAGGQMTRAQVLRNVVESNAVDNHFFIRAFVAMQFFGYLRRDPDTTGYNNWVATLNADPSNYRHMIFGFLYSPEYRGRFGTP